MSFPRLKAVLGTVAIISTVGLVFAFRYHQSSSSSFRHRSVLNPSLDVKRALTQIQSNDQRPEPRKALEGATAVHMAKKCPLEGMKPPPRDFGRGGRSDTGAMMSDDDLQETMRRRREHVQHVCSRLNLSQVPADRDRRLRQVRLWADLVHDYVYCPMGKVGSTNWLSLMLVFAGYATEDVLNITNPDGFWSNTWFPLKKILDKKGASALFQNYAPGTAKADRFVSGNSSRRWIVVRHPFERLASAYRNKVIELDYVRSNLLKRRPKNSTGLPPMPTFSEFVDMIIATQSHDYHWNSIMHQCSPCDIDFDYIIRYDNLESEAEFLLRSVKAPIKKYPSIRTFYNKTRGGKSSAALIQDYFDKLSVKQYKHLYAMYKTDFELFNF